MSDNIMCTCTWSTPGHFRVTSGCPLHKDGRAVQCTCSNKLAAAPDCPLHGNVAAEPSMVRHELRVDVYRVVQERLERAIPRGLRRAWKHTGHMPDDHEIERIASHVEDEIMLHLDEVIDWGNANG